MLVKIKMLGVGNCPVKHIMNTDFVAIHPDDTLLTVIKAYDESKIDTLPVVDHDGRLVGVFPRRKLYKALLENHSLEASCEPYIVHNPVVNYAELMYDTTSMVGRVLNSRVGNVPVLDPEGKLVGMIGKLEYLRTSLDLTIESYALLEAIFEAMYEGIIVVDNEGMILRVNASAENMFGVRYENILGKYLEDAFSELTFSTEPRYGYKCTVRGIPVLINQVPIMENQELVGMNIAFLDMSDIETIAHELEIVKELQSTLGGVLGASADGVFVTDRYGRIKYANEMARQLIDEPEELVGRSIEEVLHSKLAAQVRKTGIAEVDICRINERNCVVSHVPIEQFKDGKPVGVVSTVYGSENRLTDEIARKWISLRQQVQYYRDELQKHGVDGGSFDQIVTRNQEFDKIKKEGQRIARSSSTVLLTGESGVGKDMFARAIHSASPRSKQPFVKVNCAAIPETLLESELFGYAPGSFTGASKKGKIGYFEQANQGTIFLDEIGDMPLSIQVKILQVLQDKQFMRVGGTSPQKVDVRIISATNRDLREAISKAEFREDLFYRLNVIEFKLPPLRARSEDIIPLAEMFVQKYNHILGAEVLGISREAQALLQQYKWPGNIRELENAVERAANYVWEGEIGVEHLPQHIWKNSEPDSLEPLSYRDVLKDADKEIILDALRVTDGNKSAAARLLKISRSAFYEKLAKYGLT